MKKISRFFYTVVTLAFALPILLATAPYAEAGTVEWHTAAELHLLSLGDDADYMGAFLIMYDAAWEIAASLEDGTFNIHTMPGVLDMVVGASDAVIASAELRSVDSPEIVPGMKFFVLFVTKLSDSGISAFGGKNYVLLNSTAQMYEDGPYFSAVNATHPAFRYDVQIHYLANDPFVEPVPEPASALLLALGGVAMLLRCRQGRPDVYCFRIPRNDEI